MGGFKNQSLNLDFRDGLFSINVVRGIDDKQTSYDDAEERRALEQAAKMLFG